MVAKFHEYNIVSVDLETTGLSPHDSRILLCQIGFPDSQFVIDTRKVDLGPILPFMASNNWLKIFFNGKFDMQFLMKTYGAQFRNIFDCYIAERILFPEKRGGQSFEDLALSYLKIHLNKEVRKSFIGKSASEFSEEQVKYAAEDVEYLFPLYEAHKQALADRQQTHIAQLEFDLVPVIASMELTGIPVDKGKWREILADYAVEQSETRLNLLGLLFQKAPETFSSQLGFFDQEDNATPEDTKPLNLGSPAQVLKAFKSLGVNIPNTTDRTIQLVNHPAAKELTKYRGLDKIRTSYGEASFLEKVHPFTGRIHPSWKQMGTETGRFACKDPNMQQMPAKFRSCIVADGDWVLIGSDFSQMELRILAQESKDPVMLRAFQEGEDIHTVTASMMFNTPFDKVTKDQRFVGKCVTGDTLIDTTLGMIPIKNISKFREEDNFSPIALTVFNQDEKPVKATSFYYGGYKPTKKITLVGGRQLEGTPNHRIKVIRNNQIQWVFLGDIVIGDQVLLVEREFKGRYQKIKFNFWSTTNTTFGTNLPEITFNESWAEIFGVIFGDGNINGHSIDISGHIQDIDFLENFRYLCSSVGLTTTLTKTRNDNLKVHIGSRRLRRFLDLFDIKGPHIPTIVTNSPSSVVRSYIRGLYDTDGWHSTDGVGFCSQYETFVRELQIVLGRLGIFSTIEKTFNKTYNKNYWKLGIHGYADIETYFKLIGFKSSRKALNPKGVFNNKRTSRPRNRNIVKSIEDSVSEVFDLYVPDGNQFIGNGLVNHNTLNFGISYGMGISKLADTLTAETKKTVSQQQAINLMERYKDTYKVAIRWLGQMGITALRDGVVETRFGRKRYFSPASTSLSAQAYKAQIGAIKRQGANSIIQGGNADITKIAMVSLHNELKEYNFRGSIILQIHDELVVLAHKTQSESIKILVEQAMLSAGQQLLPDVPVVVQSYQDTYWRK